MPYQIFTAGTVRRKKDGTFAKKGANVSVDQSYDLNEARAIVMGTNDYIKYTGEELKNFLPGRIPEGKFDAKITKMLQSRLKFVEGAV